MAPAFVNLAGRFFPGRDPKLSDKLGTGSTLADSDPGDSGPSLSCTNEVGETLLTRPSPNGPVRVVYVSQGEPRDITHAPKVRRRLLVRGEAHSGQSAPA
eukprot:5606223-Prymnesium_polylepis.1